ncbi:hypothetical protein MMC16_005441 [Acarospora aff. strigata]|nr:hypothetical protein [Acarospora aff. strigata]
MAPISPSSAVLPVALALLSLSRLSIAQLSSCDAVACPLDEYTKPRCVIGNTTARAIGVSSFTSPLSSQPLTWTIAVQSIDEPPNSFERNFFIGTSPSLKMTDGGSSRSQACALFFEGVATRTKFPGSDPEYDQGTCNDALTQSCVDDLRTQARAELANIRGGRDNSSSSASVCASLGDALRGRAPKTCSVASDGHWGDILVRPLTGATAAPPVKQGDCHPTVGKDYDLALVASNRLTPLSRTSRDLAPILFGVTPIMTVVYGGGVPEPQMDMSCLKTIGPKGNTSTKRAGGAVTQGGGRGTALFVGLLCLSAPIFWGIL